MITATKIRIYPNIQQEEKLAKAFGCARWYWNNSLAETQKTYQETGKGLGQGLSFPLNQFDVSQSADKPVFHLNSTDTGLELTDWHVKNFIPLEDYMAAIALKGNHQQVSYFQAFL